MRKFFVLATMVMDRLRYPMKFSLIFVIVLAPLLVLSGIVINSMHKEIEMLKHERMGLEYIQTVRLPIEHMQQHRGMTAALLSGSEEFRSRIMEKRKDVDKYMQQLAEVDQRLGGHLKTDGMIDTLQSQWDSIKANSMNQESAVAIKSHSKLIADMISLMSHVADSSEITLGSRFDRLYMGAALVHSLPNMIENMGQARAVGSGVAAKGKFEGNSFVRLSVLSNNIDIFLKSVRSGLDVAYEHNPEVAKNLKAPTDANNSAVNKMQNLLRDKLLEAEKIDVNSTTIFDAATQAISGSYKLYDQLAPELDQQFAKHINADNRVLWTSIAIVILVLSVLAYLFAGLYLSIRSSIDSIGQATGRMADGDLTTRVSLSCRDEMTEIANYFNGMVEKFSCLIQQITGATGQLATASEEVSVIAKEGAANVERQRQETEQVATAINEMTATVRDVANNASEAANAANSADNEANGGKSVVESAAQVIGKLASEVENAATVIKGVETNSNEIGGVLDVIKGIAEQTNLLALNAAIEAARAGEQGRGFAVVADEVRTLASRTQESTHEIEQMIDKLQSGARNAVAVMELSREQAHTGVEQANEAARALAAITTAVNTIRDFNTQIASAAEEQSVVSEEINQNVHSISDISEQTAVGSEQTTAAANELAQLASQLQSQVAQFKTSCS